MVAFGVDFGSCWNTQNLQNIKKSICFLGPFAICTFLLLLMLVWVSKLAQVRSKLAHVGLLEHIGVQVEPSWHQLGSRCVNFVPSWPPKKNVSEWGKNQIHAKLTPNLHLKGPGASPRGCTHPLA